MHLLGLGPYFCPERLILEVLLRSEQERSTRGKPLQTYTAASKRMSAEEEEFVGEGQTKEGHTQDEDGREEQVEEVAQEEQEDDQENGDSQQGDSDEQEAIESGNEDEDVDEDENPYSFEKLTEILRNDQQIKALKAREGHKKVVRRLKKWLIVQKVVSGNNPKTLPAAARVDAVRRVVKEAHDIIDGETLHTPRTPPHTRASPKVNTRRLSLPLFPPPTPLSPTVPSPNRLTSTIPHSPKPTRASRESPLSHSPKPTHSPTPRDEYKKLQKTTANMSQQAKNKYERGWLESRSSNPNSPKEEVSLYPQPPSTNNN